MIRNALAFIFVWAVALSKQGRAQVLRCIEDSPERRGQPAAGESSVRHPGAVVLLSGRATSASCTDVNEPTAKPPDSPSHGGWLQPD